MLDLLSPSYDIGAPNCLGFSGLRIGATALHIGKMPNNKPRTEPIDVGLPQSSIQGQIRKPRICSPGYLGDLPARASHPPIRRKMLPENNKAVDGPPEPIELSVEGEKFSKELEERFYLSKDLDVSICKSKALASPNSSLTTSLGKSLAMELFYDQTFGNEVMATQRHRSIRETFQDVFASSSSLRWLRSIGKGRKPFSRPPIPEF